MVLPFMVAYSKPMSGLKMETKNFGERVDVIFWINFDTFCTSAETVP